MATIQLINGPNLNLLGTREPNVYGADTLAQIEARTRAIATDLGFDLEAVQHNSEGGLIEAVQAAGARGVDFIIINPAAFTHTSIALRDAFLAVGIPFIEVHISNVYRRESFRHQSYLSDIANGLIMGLGTIGYELALRAAATQLKS